MEADLAAMGRELAEMMAAKDRALISKEEQIGHLQNELARRDSQIHSMETRLKVHSHGDIIASGSVCMNIGAECRFTTATVGGVTKQRC